MTTPAEATLPVGPNAVARVAVVLASAGRAELLGEVVDGLAHQTWRDFTLVVSVPDSDSLPDHLPEGTVVVNDRGLTAQRNEGVAAVPDATHIFFFDDDAVIRDDYLEQGMGFFAAHPDVVGLTGRVLLDGATGAAIGLEEARDRVASSWLDRVDGAWRPSRELYGCNFAYRRSSASGERFDERLPLYGWLEDLDFARKLLHRGRLAKVDDCVIVHRGVKSGGRTSHERLGYTQVMNPAYLRYTGSFPLWLAVSESVRPVTRNILRSLVHDERTWRRERLLGNVRAVADVARRRYTPERAIEIGR